MYPEVRAAVAADAGPDFRAAGFDLAAHREEVRLASLELPREEVGEVEDVDADGVPCRLYVPAGRGGRGGGAPARRRVRLQRRRRPRRLQPPAREPVRSPGAERGLPASPRAPVPRRARRRRHASWGGWAGRTCRVAGPSTATPPAPTSRWSPRCGTPGLFAAAALVYPFLEPRAGHPSYDEGAASGFDPAEARWYWEQYADESAWDDPDVAPLRSDRLATLPPTLVATAEHDPLRDEGEVLARRLAEEGVETVGVRCLGQTHGFWRHDAFTASEPLVRQVSGFLDQHLA